MPTRYVIPQRRPQRRPQVGSRSGPPPFAASIRVDRVYRFQASSAVSADVVSSTSLCDLLCMATGADAAYGIARAVKVRKIEIWGPMAQNLTPVTVSVEWAASGSAPVAGPSNIVSDTSMGSARCAHVVSTPPPQSACAFWQVASGEAMFTLGFPAGSVVDLHLSQVFFDGETPVAVSTGVAGATVGQVYLRPLDSVTPGAFVLTPTSYPTI